MFKRKLLSVCIAATAMSSAELVWSATDSEQGAAGQGARLEEVVVSARRTEEIAQDVPVAMQAISGETLQQLQMTTPAELSKLAPGLNISLSDSKTPNITLRGIRWASGSGTPAIPVYLNEISFDPGNTLLTMYDMGKVEVLRGPQGTARGAPSISGAVTMTTATPNLYKVEGYVSGLVGSLDHQNLQGAINVPIIDGKLAVRVAASMENTEANHVTSENSSEDPSTKLRSTRLTVLFEPNDSFSLTSMYEHIENHSTYFNQVVGSGSAGYTGNAAATAKLGYALPATVAANYNGPSISLGDYKAVQEMPNVNDQPVDLFTTNMAWELLGQGFDYNFGYQRAYANLVSSLDFGNAFIGFDAPQESSLRKSTSQAVFHELRMSSLRQGDSVWDYDVGAYYQHNTSNRFDVDIIGGLLGGAYGNPAGAPSPVINPSALARYGLPGHLKILLDREDYSVYGDVNFHLPADTELTLGARRLREDLVSSLGTTLGTSSYNAIVDPLYPSVGCAGLAALSPKAAGAIDSPYYTQPAGICDIPVNQSVPVDSSSNRSFATIYNIQLSHKFTPDVLGYATVGSSWRGGLPSINNPGLPAQYSFPKPESATSFELGVKSDLSRTVRLNADVFKIDYKDQINQYQYTPYYNSISGATGSTSVAFYSNVNDVVQGAEVSLDVAPLDRLVLGLSLSYAEIKSSGGSVPCTDPSRPLTAANPINFCPSASGEVLNSSPKVQGTLTGSYSIPFGQFDGYVRGVLNYQGNNPNVGASTESTEAFSTVDLFVGIDKAGDWDIGLYSKNLFDKTVQLTTNGIPSQFNSEALFGPTGYSNVTATPPREVGVTARYEFGKN